MKGANYMELPSLPSMPLTIEQKLLAPGGITPTAFDRKNDVLTNAALQTEGFCGDDLAVP